MNSTNDQRVSSPLTSKLVVHERERLQRRWERERACHDSETAKQREERRARHAAQTVQQRESCLQQRRDRLAAK